MGELVGGGVEREQNAGEIDAHSCTVGGGDVCAVLEVSSREARLDVLGPGQLVEGLRGGEKEKSLLLIFGASRGV